MLEFFAVANGVLGIIKTLKGAMDRKNKIKSLRAQIGALEKQSKTAIEAAHAAGFDLQIADDHANEADRLWDALNRIRNRLIPSGDAVDLQSVKADLRQLDNSLVRVLVNRSLHGMSESSDRTILKEAKESLSADFATIHGASQVDTLFNAETSALGRADTIGGVRISRFTVLANSLQQV